MGAMAVSWKQDSSAPIALGVLMLVFLVES